MKSPEKSNWLVAPTIATFLSNLLGTYCGGHKLNEEQLSAAASIVQESLNEQESKDKKKKNADKKKKKLELIRFSDGSRAPTDLIAPANLWQRYI